MARSASYVRGFDVGSSADLSPEQQKRTQLRWTLYTVPPDACTVQRHGLVMEGLLKGSLSIVGLQGHQEQPKLSRLQAQIDEGVPVGQWLLHSALAIRGACKTRIASTSKREREPWVHKELQITNAKQRTQQAEAMMIVNNHNCREFHEDSIALVATLKACAKRKDLCEGSRLHAHIQRRGLLRTNIYVGTGLVNMYAKCGALAEAQEVFEQLPSQDVVTWTTLIAGYAQHGHGHEALDCFNRMICEGHSPNAVTFASVLKACGNVGAVETGEEIHAEVVRQRLLGKDTILGTALVDMYAKCGALAKAQEVFDELSARNVISWSALIAGYAQHGNGHEALNCFEQMKHEGLSPNAITFVCILKACGSIGAVGKGKEVHAEVVRQRLLEKNTILGNALIDMYAKCGELENAREVFDELSVRDIVAWSALIAGYAQHGHGLEALNLFEQMRREGLTPNAITFACILKACGSIGAAKKGEEIHAEVVRHRYLEKDTILGTVLVDMYARCGALTKAHEVFNELPVRDVVSWSALIAGYAQHGHGHEALNCFEQMQREGFYPNAVTFLCILKACGCAGAAEKGEEIHAEIVRQRLLEEHTVLGNALVDMYAKCGRPEKALEVFDKLPVRDVVSWSVLIAGYAQLGKVTNAFNLFKKMIVEGIEPDLITFTVLLNACSHAGLVEEGEIFFVTMSSTYGLTPTLEHCTCMVDLFGRAGHLKKAVGLINMFTPADSAEYFPLWEVFLGACQKWGNVPLGRLAFENLVQLDGEDAAAYVCMCNIYAAARMPEEAKKIEAMRVENKAWKLRG